MKRLAIFMISILILALSGCTSERESVSYENEPVEIEEVQLEPVAETGGRENGVAPTQAPTQAPAEDQIEPELEPETEAETKPQTELQINPQTESEGEDRDDSGIELVQTNGQKAQYVDAVARINQQDSTYTVFVTASDGKANTVWERKFEGVPMTELEPVSDTTTDENAFYIEIGGNLHGLSRKDGQERFDPVSVGCIEIPLLDNEGHIYTAGYYGPLMSKVTVEGSVVWVQEGDRNGIYALEPFFSGNSVYVACEERDGVATNTVQIDKDTGNVIRYFWYDAGEVLWDRIVVSSTLEGYPAEYMFDRLPETAWVEGEKDQGINENIEFMSAKPLTFSKVFIQNGYHKSEALYYKNSRVKELVISSVTGEAYVFTLEDSMKTQLLELPEPITSKDVVLRIDSVYPGSAYTDTVISTIKFFE